MKKFDKYFDNNKIISYLCRIRAKLARQRNKKHLIHLLTKNQSFNYHNKKQNEYEKELCDLLPCRKKWKNIGEKYRKYNDNTINSVDKNVLSIKKTIKFYQKHNPNEKFLQNLNKFISEIKASILDENYIIPIPSIYPKPKDKIKKEESNPCRPISSYSLKDKIIISLTNKYFTELFDRLFYKYSFAFRATKSDNNEKKVLSHSDAIKKILDYRININAKHLWVVECDIQKFYDTVNHKIIRKKYQSLIKKVKRKNPDFYDFNAERIFYKYLDSYQFNRDVLPLNNDNEFWKTRKITNGKFEWVENGFKKYGYYKDLKRHPIGIPQGERFPG